MLLLTARTEIPQRIEGLDAGADDYLPKPFAAVELMARVRAMLRRKSNYTPDILSVGSTVLDRGTLEVSCREKTASLSAREFQILEIMMQNPRVIIPAEQLMTHIWGWDSNVDMSVIWVHISNLRKKIGTINAPITVKFIRNAGYMLVNELRKKLVRVCGISAIALLAVIYACIYILSARQLNGAMDMLADRISENGGSFPEYSAGEQEDMGGPAPGFINEETRFSVRFFIVSFDDEGLVTGENIAAMRSVTQQSAAGYGIKAAASGSERGWIDDYRYKKYENSQGYDIVFVDGAMNRSVFRMTMLSAGAALTGSGIVLFILMVVFSKRAVRPIAESYEKQKQFITDANHELKTPLTLIMTNIDIVQSEIGENEWLQDAKCEGSRMNDLINQMGILTKMDEGADGGEKARLDLSGLVTEKARSFVPLAESRNKKLMAAIDGGTVCFGHRQDVEKLMDILFDNAIKYCDEGGTITVALRNRRRPLLTVENTYRSAQKVETDKLFDRFYRGDRSRTPSGGFGIGLSIAKAIVKDQGGEINAYIKSGDIVGFKVVFR